MPAVGVRKVTRENETLVHQNSGNPTNTQHFRLVATPSSRMFYTSSVRRGGVGASAGGAAAATAGLTAHGGLSPAPRTPNPHVHHHHHLQHMQHLSHPNTPASASRADGIPHTPSAAASSSSAGVAASVSTSTSAPSTPSAHVSAARILHAGPRHLVRAYQPLPASVTALLSGMAPNSSMSSTPFFSPVRCCLRSLPVSFLFYSPFSNAFSLGLCPLLSVCRW
jgi:hypothetical protein